MWGRQREASMMYKRTSSRDRSSTFDVEETTGNAVIDRGNFSLKSYVSAPTNGWLYN